jgi:hypothetical protein
MTIGLSADQIFGINVGLATLPKSFTTRVQSELDKIVLKLQILGFLHRLK